MSSGVFASLVSFGTDLGSLELYDPGHGLGDLGFFHEGFKTFGDFAKVLPQVAQLVIIGAFLVGVAIIAAIALPSVLGVVGAITSPSRFGLE